MSTGPDKLAGTVNDAPCASVRTGTPPATEPASCTDCPPAVVNITEMLAMVLTWLCVDTFTCKRCKLFNGCCTNNVIIISLCCEVCSKLFIWFLIDQQNSSTAFIWSTQHKLSESSLQKQKNISIQKMGKKSKYAHSQPCLFGQNWGINQIKWCICITWSSWTKVTSQHSSTQIRSSFI